MTGKPLPTTKWKPRDKAKLRQVDTYRELFYHANGIRLSKEAAIAMLVDMGLQAALGEASERRVSGH